MSLNQLISKNSYPIVFIGSGMSRRYLEEYPGWIGLLEEFWNQLSLDEDFYGVLNEEINTFMKSGKSKEESSFLANCTIATYTEDKYDTAFNKGEIDIPDFKPKDSYDSGISPFRYSISKRFSEYTIIPNMLDEYILWGNFIRKAQIIITTNYDSLIEDTYSYNSNESLKIYIGQEGFFDNTSGSSELFKIHGCQTDPNSIIISDKDYEKFDKNSILISAKILSSLINSPIIFLGYSMTDCNVRRIISDFTSQLPKEDFRISANRIIVIERLKGETKMIEEVIKDKDIGSYTLIKTDDYSEIYRKLAEINQGLSPYEIRRYQDVMKKLIISQGTKGSLDAVLLAPKDLDSLENDIDMNKPIVVAFGDKKHIYVMPDFINYMKDYIFKENGILPTVALSFIAKEPIKARIPFARYINQVSDIDMLELTQQDKDKLKNKIDKYMHSLNKIIDDINQSNKIESDKVWDIWNNEDYQKSKKLEIIIFNIKELDSKELDEFIKEEAFPLLIEVNTDNTSILRSTLRKLFYAYDLLINGELKKFN